MEATGMYALSLICALVLGADGPVQDSAPQAEGRRFHEIGRDISAAMQREAAAKDLVERTAAVKQLTDLFTEVDRDARTPTSPTLLEYRGRVRSRLVNVQTELKHKLAREYKRAKAKGQYANDTPADLLALAANAEQRELAQHVAAQVSLASYSMGGPARVFESAGGAFGGGIVIDDNGEELVELIQNTISPRVWEVNGGPCTIVYYRPLMCLVVRATGTTHGDVGGLLEGLRAAGP
jgi:hypothetical protein